ncbi:MAG: RHS repeat-associated core domain-containing protein [Anaerolineae bacterium]
MRQDDVVYFIHSDHLGSTSLTTDIIGTVVAETRYLPYGEERWITGTLVTDFTFTGQRAEAGFRLMDYNARYYDPGLGRFVSADTVVPEYANPQSLNRYSYVLNRPLQGGDPTGHQGPVEEDFLSPEEYEAWLDLSGRNPELTYEQFEASREAYYAYANDPQLYRQDLEAINRLAEGSVEEAWYRVTHAKLYSEYVLHARINTLISLDVAREGFAEARQSDDPNYFLWGTIFYGAILSVFDDGNTLDADIIHDEGWSLLSVHAEPATRKGARGSGVSIQEVYENIYTGERKVRHIVRDDRGRVVDDHFRPFYKPRTGEIE